MPEVTLPACGLCRTVFPLPGNDAVPAGTLVYFHNHSDGDEGPPVVQLPEKAEHNRWTFQTEKHAAEDLRWCASLVPLPKEGFYQLTAPLWIGNGQKLPSGLLVQLGYTRKGQPAAFPGLLINGGTIQFQRRGAILTDLQLNNLRRSDFRLLAVQPKPATKPEAESDDTGSVSLEDGDAVES